MRHVWCSPILLTVFLLVWTTYGQRARCQTQLDARVTDLLAKLTLEEKVGQLNLFSVDKTDLEQAIAAGKVGAILNAVGAAPTNKLQRLAIERSRLHIPLLFGFDVVHGYRTIFPIPLGLASTWDPGAVESMARISAREASAAGVRWTYSPMVDIARDPRWGRIAEGAGEDPVLGSAMSAAYVRGYQGTELSDPSSIAACAKHYVGYGAAEGGRDYNSVDMSEGHLREVYLPPFKAAAEAGAATFMSSFNTVNGVPATANRFTLRQVLKGEWSFRGFVVSDWNAIGELVPHGVAKDKRDAAREALIAGVDMDMSSEVYLDYIASLVRSGVVPMSIVDDAVRRVLLVKFQLGLFERPYVDEQHQAGALLTAESRAAARAIAQKSIVLLRNEGNVLPLSKSVGTIAVIGPLADSKTDVLGSWFGKGTAAEAISVLEGVRATVSAALLYSKGVDVAGESTDGIAQAVEMARQADVILLVLGEGGDMSGEAASRSSLNLPGQQEKLLEAVAATGKTVVLVLMSGRPLAISWAAEHVSAILEVWFPGSEGGNAIADIVFGDANPSGRLPVSFPRAVGQVPIYYSHLNTGRPPGVDPRYQTGYLDLPSSPLYPFGYGLSYSKFAYRGLHTDNQIGAHGELQASMEVTNTGSRAGEEVVQLYLQELVSPIVRPVTELKQFKRVVLKPGETRKVEFTVTRGQLASLGPDMRFAVRPGTYSVAVGPNSAQVMKARFEVPALKDDRARKTSTRVPQVSSKRAKPAASGR
ncbi:MAG TPA: glycoside hydrolase family 3 N-terminal domain-containing protein [Methylocella sp.]